MKSYSPALRLAVLFTAAVLISNASAQSGGGGSIFGGGRSGGGRGGDAQGGGRASRNERPVTPPDSHSYEQIEYRLSLLQEDLKLRNEQNDVWQSFANKTRSYLGDLARERALAMQTTYANMEQMNGLKHIGQTVDAAQNRLTALQDVESSAKALYETLTAEQKTLADMRIPTIIAPRQTGPGGNSTGSNLPDLGSSAKPPR